MLIFGSDRMYKWQSRLRRLPEIGHAGGVKVIVNLPPAGAAARSVCRIGPLCAHFKRGGARCADWSIFYGSVEIALLRLFQFLSSGLLHDCFDRCITHISSRLSGAEPPWPRRDQHCKDEENMDSLVVMVI